MAANWQCENCCCIVYSDGPHYCMDCGSPNFRIMTEAEERASMEAAGMILDETD